MDDCFAAKWVSLLNHTWWKSAGTRVPTPEQKVDWLLDEVSQDPWAEEWDDNPFVVWVETFIDADKSEEVADWAKEGF